MYQTGWIKMGDLNTKSNLFLWKMIKKTRRRKIRLTHDTFNTNVVSLQIWQSFTWRWLMVFARYILEQISSPQESGWQRYWGEEVQMCSLKKKIIFWGIRWWGWCWMWFRCKGGSDGGGGARLGFKVLNISEPFHCSWVFTVHYYILEIEGETLMQVVAPDSMNFLWELPSEGAYWESSRVIFYLSNKANVD